MAEDDMFKAFEEESDAFFDQLLSDAGVSPKEGKTPVLTPAPEVPDAGATQHAAVTCPAAAPFQPPERAVPGTKAVAGDAGSQMRSKLEARKAAVEGTAAVSSSDDPEFEKLAQKFESVPRQAPQAGAVKPVPAVSSAAPPSAKSATTPPVSQNVAVASAPAAQVPAKPMPAAQPGATGAPVSMPASASAAVTFRMDDGDNVPIKATDCSEAVPSLADFTQPGLPAVPSDFTAEDLTLREVLVEFYMCHNASNLVHVNSIVKKYRGLAVSHLWASLATKYSVPAPDAINLLARTIYITSPFEYTDVQQQADLEQALEEIRRNSSPPDRATMLRKAIEHGAGNGSDAALRLLCFRGVPDECKLRPQVWKILLGYLPMARYSEWNAIQGEKRALFASYKADLLVVSEDSEVSLKEGKIRPNELNESQALLHEIRQDVDRTRRDFEYFRKPSTRAAMIALLFIYARLNPGVRYVQGMNEVAAIILHVLASAEADAEALEADCFWCFSELMVEIKENFMQVLDHSEVGIYALVNGVQTLMGTYDPQLAKHLQQAELPPFLWAFRWCTLLFAQDATLPDVVRLWDSFIADPRRFEFCIHICLALVLAHRDELLQTDKQFALTEVLQSAARNSDFELQVRRAMAICAFERRQQTPPFPVKSTPVLEDLSDLMQTAAASAQEAAAKAQEVSAEMSRNIQENIAPVVIDKASKASEAAAVAATEGAQAVQAWLEETAPARKEAMEKASTHFSSLWSSVRANAIAASTLAKEKGQRLAAEYGQTEAVDRAAAKFTSAADSAAVGFSTVYEKASAAAQQLASGPASQSTAMASTATALETEAAVGATQEAKANATATELEAAADY